MVGAVSRRGPLLALAILLTFGLLIAPLFADAQRAKAVRVGYTSGNPQSDTNEALAAFRTKLQSLGYVAGQNLIIESRYAEGHYDRLPKLAAELVRLNVNVIFVYSTPGTLAAKKATDTIPIVFAGVSDPLVAGIVPNLTRPGRNVTGVTLDNPELSPKRLSLLKEAVPSASRVGVLVNPDFKATPAMLDETRSAARTLGLDLHVVETRAPGELAKAFDTLSVQRANALAVLADPMFVAQRRRIAELAASHRIPAIYHLRQFVEAGGLMFYGADYVEAFEQAAVLVDKVLKGAKPTDLPVERPWRFALAINLKTAKALGLTIPQSLLLRADQVIQ